MNVPAKWSQEIGRMVFTAGVAIAVGTVAFFTQWGAFESRLAEVEKHDDPKTHPPQWFKDWSDERYESLLKELARHERIYHE